MIDEAPLIDEMVLIDSNSKTERWRSPNRWACRVYRHADILPEAGTYQGKGEALWKSLAVLKGDIIVWIDTDITNVHPRFVYGLLGPLLKRPGIQYVKGFYQRPLRVDGVLQAVGGGRVTELIARRCSTCFTRSCRASSSRSPANMQAAGRRLSAFHSSADTASRQGC